MNSTKLNNINGLFDDSMTGLDNESRVGEVLSHSHNNAVLSNTLKITLG